MRIFQNSGIYRSYRPRLKMLTKSCETFDSAKQAFLNDRFGTAHFLKPVIEGDASSFFVNGDDEFSQRLWAKENGLPSDTILEDILLAQIEHHRSEVFYNLDPMRYGDEFIKRLPSAVKRTVAWRAAPSQGGQFLNHDIIVNNFPSLLEGYRSQGANAAYLSPAHDPVMDSYAENTDRPIDVLFIGTYSRHHRLRASMLDAIASLGEQLSVVMHLDTSLYTRLAETPLGWIGPLNKDRRSRAVRSVARAPVFGRELLKAISQSKIVVNGAIDMAGKDRGNMRIWEALGCGAALISDSGNYPNGIREGEHFEGYNDAGIVPSIIDKLIADSGRRLSIAKAGHQTIGANYSKDSQWQRFVEIVS